VTAPDEITVGGFATGAFTPIADIFARMVLAQGGGGAALAIYSGGVPVVDLYGGSYQADTLQLVHSVSKVPSAIAAAIAQEAGLIDLDAPLSACWPEFSRAETASITLRMVLSHRAGLPGVREPLSYEDLLTGRYEDAIAAEEPYWEPGTAHGYHGFTMGSLLDGAFGRALGVRVGPFVADRIAAPLGLDLWIGTPADVHPRVAKIVRGTQAQTPLQAERARLGLRLPDGHWAGLPDRAQFNSPEVLSASWPAVNAVTGARDLARLLAATLGEVDGVRLLSPAALAELARPHSRGPDRTLGVPSQFGCGVQLPFPQLPFLGPASFGHEAAGGSMACADPELGLAVGFVTNMHPALNGASAPALALLPTIRHLATADASVL
jgi:CubicO group peptidase (beta-lactamase class C family)